MAICYTKYEELAHTWSHAAGVLLGLVSGFFFFRLLLAGNDPWAFWGVGLYLAGMLASYITSTVYHALPAGNSHKEPMRRWDHAAIYWHIAGSYAPFTLIVLREEAYWGWGLFAFIWISACAGTWMSFRRLKEHSNLETCCFIAMGLVILVAFQSLVRLVGWGVMGWVVAEGIFYITGALFYTLHQRPYMHFVFHLFVLGGSLSHVLAVWKLLLL